MSPLLPPETTRPRRRPVWFSPHRAPLQPGEGSARRGRTAPGPGPSGPAGGGAWTGHRAGSPRGHGSGRLCAPRPLGCRPPDLEPSMEAYSADSAGTGRARGGIGAGAGRSQSCSSPRDHFPAGGGHACPRCALGMCWVLLPGLGSPSWPGSSLPAPVLPPGDRQPSAGTQGLRAAVTAGGALAAHLVRKRPALGEDKGVVFGCQASSFPPAFLPEQRAIEGAARPAPPISPCLPRGAGDGQGTRRRGQRPDPRGSGSPADVSSSALAQPPGHRARRGDGQASWIFLSDFS